MCAAKLKRVVHPGKVLRDELAGYGVSPTALARHLAVPPNRIGQIIAGKHAATGDTALRLGRWLGVDPRFRLNLQTECELAEADRLWARIAAPPAARPRGL